MKRVVEAQEERHQAGAGLSGLTAALSLAMELVCQEQPVLEDCLSRIAGALGALRVQWLSPSTTRLITDRRDSLEIDWGLIEGLELGEVHVVGTQDRHRSPRLDAQGWHEILVAGESAGRGTLRILSRQAMDHGHEALRGLAAFVARFAEAEKRARKHLGEKHELQIGRRVATVTHDLRNQLNLALLQLSKLSLAGGAPSEFDLLGGTLADARDMCRESLVHPERRATPKAVDLRRVLIDEAHAAADIARGHQHVGVSVRCPRGLTILGERDALKRLIENLILNAIEASSEGGDVRASAELTSDAQVVLEVSDRGRGMSGNALQEFFHAGATGSNGTGYGTTSFLENLSALEAEARVESVLGEGTCVRVFLRAAPQAGNNAAIICDRDVQRGARWVEALAKRNIGAWIARSPSAALGLLRCMPSPLLVLSRGTHGSELGALAERVRRERIRCLLVSARDGSPERILARPGMQSFMGATPPRAEDTPALDS